MRRRMAVLLASLCVAGCAAADPSAEPSVNPGSPSASVESSSVPSPSPTPELTASATPMPSESAAPRALFGTWRTTLGGQPLSLGITESTYRIVRGSNAAEGSVRVDGDQIEFFGSSLCGGTGTYRWMITDGSLSFFPLEEPCPGRAEALLVRYPDYAPPGGG